MNERDEWMSWEKGMNVQSEWKSTPPPPSFFNGFQEIRKSNSGKTGVDMSTPVHPVATPLFGGVFCVKRQAWFWDMLWKPKQRMFLQRFFSHSELPNNCHKIIKISSSPLASIIFGRCILSQSKGRGPKNFLGASPPNPHSSLSPLNLPWPRRHAAVAVMTELSANDFSVSK